MWKLAAKYLYFISVAPLKTANNPDGGSALVFSSNRCCPQALLKRGYVLRCCT